MKQKPPPTSRSLGFTLMEILVVIAIILVLAAIAFPVFAQIQMRANKQVALRNMNQLGAAAATYTAENNGTLPAEDSKGTDTWGAAANPENANAWYNVLPRRLGNKGVDQYASNPQAFYSKENILFLPGALYPETDKKLAQPMFAISINTKLQRKDEQGEKPPAKLSQITHPSRTVLFLNRGCRKSRKPWTSSRNTTAVRKAAPNHLWPAMAASVL